ncbi:MAG TPA: hypothetical protein VFG31_07820, partial [Conexibacter sp.]|nr:hypothetical protein [Conexibacter sp.]
MGVTSGGRVPLGRLRAASRDGGAIELRASTAAWIAAVPCALLTYLAVRAVGPWLGDQIYPAHPTFHFLGGPSDPKANAAEVGPFLVSLAGPIVLALAIVALTRRPLTLPRAAVVGVTAVVQLLLVVVVAACLDGEHRPEGGFNYFSTRTLVVSTALAVLLLGASQSVRARRLFAAHAREDRRVRLAIAGLALAATVSWLLPAVQTDHSVVDAIDVTQYHMAFYLDETFAVLNGLTPLVNFTPQYGSVWPYLVSLPLLVLGKTLLVFTAAMTTATTLALLAAFGVLRRVTRNSLAALLLFVPFLATTLYPIGETPEKLVSLATFFAFYPLRYAGPLIVAWLTARHLGTPKRRRAWPLFAVAGIVAINNTDMGVAAVGATLAAFLWTDWPRNRAQVIARAADVVGGLLLAVALVSTVTLVRSGSLPHFDQLTEFARIFGLNSISAVPMPGIRSLILLVYGTFAAAIATATALAIGRRRDPVLIGMLAWIGVYGLGSAIYYVARDVLVTSFAAWALAIALLAVAAFRSLDGAGPLYRRAVPALVVFFG